MKTKILVLILLSCISQKLFSQKKLPVIRATSPIVDIRDGNKLYKKAWNIVPQEKLDVYTTSGKKLLSILILIPLLSKSNLKKTMILLFY